MYQPDKNNNRTHYDLQSLHCDKECSLVCCIIVGLHVFYIGGFIYLMNLNGDISISSISS